MARTEIGAGSQVLGGGVVRAHRGRDRGGMRVGTAMGGQAVGPVTGAVVAEHR